MSTTPKHPATALTIDLLGKDADVVRQMVFVKMTSGSAVTYRVLSRQLTPTATGRHWKSWPVDANALSNADDSWITSYVKMHAERQFAVATSFVVEVTKAELDELRSDTTPRALMIRIDRARESVDADVFKPQPAHVPADPSALVGKTHKIIQAWSTTDEPEIAPAGRARAPKAEPKPAAPATAEPAPVIETAAPGSIVKPGTKVIIPSGAVYLARKIDKDLSDVTMLRTAREQNLPVLMESLPGTGKTMAALAAFGTDLYTVQCSADTEASDLVGTYVPTAVAGEFRWVDGALVRAMEEGKPLLVDEIALADSRALAVLYSAMDGRRELVVTANPSRGIVKAKDGFYVVAAYNGHVPGARMSEALLSRFPIQLTFTTDWDAMEKLGVSKTVVTAARNLDTKRQAGEISTAPQARELVNYHRTVSVFGEELALRNLVAGAPESDRAVVADVLSRAMGKVVKPLVTQ